MKNQKKIALVLAGCGSQDGANITEAISLLIAFSQFGCDVTGFAPDIEVPEIDHVSLKPTGKSRKALHEVARIFAGQHAPRDLKQLNVQDFDALCFVGGMGNATVLSDFKEKGAHCSVNPDVKKIILDFYSQSKPIGAVCISPILLARVLGSKKISITVGPDSATSKEVEKMGA